MVAFFAGANKRAFFAPYALTGKGPGMITLLTSTLYQSRKNMEAEIRFLFLDHVAVTSVQFVEGDIIQRFGDRSYLGKSVNKSRENFSHISGV